jgi:FKBP-type peptidyl-prolyl cis-trans isomerase SlyD
LRKEAIVQITGNCVVTIQYKLTDDAGKILDSSDDGEPLVYLHGTGNLIPGLENELTGKNAGDSLSVTIQPEDGYGAVDEALVQTVPRSDFGTSPMVTPTGQVAIIITE